MILSPNSSLEIVHVLKNVTLKTPQFVNYTNFYTEVYIFV